MRTYVCSEKRISTENIFKWHKVNKNIMDRVTNETLETVCRHKPRMTTDSYKINSI